MLIGLASTACRQAEETLIEDEQVSLHQDENQMSARDSTSTGFENNNPPKNGTHWKTNSKDTIKVIPPKSLVGNLTMDPTNSSSTIIDDQPQNPPKNGTHWRTK